MSGFSSSRTCEGLAENAVDCILARRGMMLLQVFDREGRLSGREKSGIQRLEAINGVVGEDVQQR